MGHPLAVVNREVAQPLEARLHSEVGAMPLVGHRHLVLRPEAAVKRVASAQRREAEP